MITRSSRSRLARILALVLAFTMFAAACGDDGGGEGTSTDDTAPTNTGDATSGAGVDPDSGAGETSVETLPPDSADPTPGGTLRISVEAETDGLNPTVNRYAVAAYQMAKAVLEPLATWDTDGFPTPYLAEGWESSEDGLTFTLFLREGITFHDGTPLNADAVIRNFEGQLADALISLAVKPALDLDNPIEKIDDLTVQYNLALPNQQFATALPSQLGLVASPAWLDAAVEDPSLNQEPVGTGPFVFESRVVDEVTRFVRNDNWWQTEVNGTEVYLDAVEYYPITDSEIAAANLAAGEVDSVGTTSAPAILALRDQDLNRLEDDFGEESFAMINASAPPFDDIRVRQALTYATPIENYLEFAAAGILRRAHNMFAPELVWHNEDVVQEGDTPDLAAPLIVEYCGENPDQCTDNKVNMNLQYSGPSVVQEDVADILIDGWSDYFNVEREVLLQDDHITEVALGQYQVVTWRQFGAPDPTADRVWLACDSMGVLSLNWPRFCDEEREQLLNDARSTTDLDERVALWDEIQQKVHDDYLYIFFTHTLWVNAFDKDFQGHCTAESPDGVPLLCTNNGSHWVHNLWLSQG